MYQEKLGQLHASILALSSEQLKVLHNDDEKLKERIDELLENLKEQKDTLLTENRSKAELNIEKEPVIADLRAKVGALLAEGKESCAAVQAKLAQIKEKSGNVSQETALALLQTAAAEVEEESEGLVKQFTDNELGVDAFLAGFLASRKTMHLRKLKAEKMQELMRQQQAAKRASMSHGGGAGGIPPAYSNLPPVSGFYPTPAGGYGANSNVPYPLAPIGPMMPMPPPRPY